MNFSALHDFISIVIKIFLIVHMKFSLARSSQRGGHSMYFCFSLLLILTQLLQHSVRSSESWGNYENVDFLSLAVKWKGINSFYVFSVPIHDRKFYFSHQIASGFYGLEEFIVHEFKWKWNLRQFCGCRKFANIFMKFAVVKFNYVITVVIINSQVSECLHCWVGGKTN